MRLIDNKYLESNQQKWKQGREEPNVGMEGELDNSLNPG